MSCLLAIDIGNTNTVLGVYEGDDLVALADKMGKGLEAVKPKFSWPEVLIP